MAVRSIYQDDYASFDCFRFMELVAEIGSLITLHHYDDNDDDDGVGFSCVKDQ